MKLFDRFNKIFGNQNTDYFPSLLSNENQIFTDSNIWNTANSNNLDSMISIEGSSIYNCD